MVKLLKLMILIVLVSAAVACDTAGKQSKNASASSAVDLRLASYNLKPVDDPGNPYKNEYTDVDCWMYDNFQQVAGDSYSMVLNLSKDSRMLHCPIDSDGYKMPYRESLISKEEALKNGDETLGVEEITNFYSAGAMSDELYEAVKHMTFEVMADYCPPVPGWLASATYERAAFAPNGDVITVGPVNLDNDEATGSDQANSSETTSCDGGAVCDVVFYRYDANGLLLGADKLFLNTYEGLSPGQYSAPVMDVRRDGVVTFADDNGVIVAVYDYDWTDLGKVIPPMRDLHYFYYYTKNKLDRIYTIQQCDLSESE